MLLLPFLLLPLLLLLLPPLLLLVPHLCLHFVVDHQAAVCKKWVEGALVAVEVLGLQEMSTNQRLEVAEVVDHRDLTACLSLSVAVMVVVVVVVAVKLVTDPQAVEAYFEQVVQAQQLQQGPSKHPSHPPLVAQTHDER